MMQITGGVCAAKGFLAWGTHCGIRKNKDKLDLALIYSQAPCAAAAVYTTNRVKGAPLTVTKQNIANGKAQAVVCNSGIANTCCADGVAKAQMMCKVTADALHMEPEDVIVASTGVIGQPLPIEPIAEAMPQLAASLSEKGGELAAKAIMTTDTKPKQIAFSFQCGGKTCHIGGMAKGSGMIHPNMATMLVFLTTDAAIEAPLLQKALSKLIVDTFNMVSVDGDTSTNDMVSVMANGMSGSAPVTDENSEDYRQFCTALYAILAQLSREIAKDGEGASKLLTCRVTGAPTKVCARAVAKSVITSNLFKCALFGEDANWGRVLCAIGYTKVHREDDFVIERVSVVLGSEFGDVTVCENGAGVDFSEERAAKILSSDEITVTVDLGMGSFEATAWGCDLTYDYVRINGDYRT